MISANSVAIAILLTLSVSGCVSTHSEITSKNSQVKEYQSIKASWYGIGDGSGTHTANGERFKPYGLTAAHKSLKFGTLVDIKNSKNNKTVTVRINDRGPFVKGLTLDLTKGAANAINMTGNQNLLMRIRNAKTHD